MVIEPEPPLPPARRPDGLAERALSARPAQADTHLVPRAHLRAGRMSRQVLLGARSSARASAASALPSNSSRRASTISSSSSAATASAGRGATPPTQARPATSRRCCIRSRSRATRTGRARTRRARRSASTSRTWRSASTSPGGSGSAQRRRPHFRRARGRVGRVDVGGPDYRARTVVVASGPLADSSLPTIRGIDTFEGHKILSAKWDHDYDLAGKRIAVIGTGASAVQIIPNWSRPLRCGEGLPAHAGMGHAASGRRHATGRADRVRARPGGAAGRPDGAVPRSRGDGHRPGLGLAGHDRDPARRARPTCAIRSRTRGCADSSHPTSAPAASGC